MSTTSNHDVVQRLGLTEHQLDRVKVLEVAGELDLWTAPTLCERIDQCLDDLVIVATHEAVLVMPRALAQRAREAAAWFETEDGNGQQTPAGE